MTFGLGVNCEELDHFTAEAASESEVQVVMLQLPRATRLSESFSSCSNSRTDQYMELTRTTRVKGGRTSAFSPELDRLFLAMRRQGAEEEQKRPQSEFFAQVR